MNNKVFDFQRFTLLLKKELWSGIKKPLIVVGATFGFILLFAFFMIYTGDGYEHLNFNMFPMVLLIGGFVFTSVSYYEFNDKTGTHHYLSLPASTFEKFVSKWLITAIVFPIVAVLLFLLYTKIGDGFYNYYIKPEVELSSWSLSNWWSKFFIKIYFAAQSIYLVGAIAFQKYTLFKTGLIGFLAFLLFGVICGVAFHIMFAEFFQPFFQMREGVHSLNTSPEAIDYMETDYTNTLENTLWLTVPLLMWIVGFLKLKEKEA